MSWAASIVECDLCGYEWIAVFDPECEKLECPNCGNMVYYELKNDTRTAT